MFCDICDSLSCHLSCKEKIIFMNKFGGCPLLRLIKKLECLVVIPNRYSPIKCALGDILSHYVVKDVLHMPNDVDCAYRIAE